MYWDYTNFIVIRHPNREYSRYDHLSYHSATVKVGQHVRAGEKIARVGTTGYTYLPHLHFQVFVVIGINVCPTINSNNYKNLKMKMREICVSRRSDSSHLFARSDMLQQMQLSRLHYGNLDDHIVSILYSDV